MRVRGLAWVGTRTHAFADTVRFFGGSLELPLGRETRGFARFDLPDGGVVEVFDAGREEYPHFSTGPVVGFEVSDFDEARGELERAGYPLLLGVGGERGGYRWQHFRGPGGLVFEIVDYPDRPAPGSPVGSLQISSLTWMGLSTLQFEETAAFYQDRLGLAVVEATENLIECALPDRSSVEAFRRGSDMDHPHFRTGPVPGFGVADLGRAQRTLEDRGVTVIRSRRSAHGGWAHFRAPDGNVYEIKQVLGT